MNRAWLVIPLFVFLGLAYLFMMVLPKDPNYVPTAFEGRPFPNFSLPTLETGEIKTEKTLQGQVHLVNFWSTWCTACKYEHPFFMELASQGIRIIGVDYKEYDNGEAAKAWLNDYGNPFVFSVFDKKGVLGLDVGLAGVPETFLVDQNGIVHFRYSGEIGPLVWESKFLPKIKELQGAK